MAKSILFRPKCIGCGRLLEQSENESHKAGHRYVGYCYNREKHEGKIIKYVIVQFGIPGSKQISDKIIDIENEDVIAETIGIASIAV